MKYLLILMVSVKAFAACDMEMLKKCDDNPEVSVGCATTDLSCTKHEVIDELQKTELKAASLKGTLWAIVPKADLTAEMYSHGEKPGTVLGEFVNKRCDLQVPAVNCLVEYYAYSKPQFIIDGAYANKDLSSYALHQIIDNNPTWEVVTP